MDDRSLINKIGMPGDDAQLSLGGHNRIDVLRSEELCR